MRPAPKRSNNQGFASGLEKRNGDTLGRAGVEYWYEEGPCVIHYSLPIVNHKVDKSASCADCGSSDVRTHHLYTADFAFTSKSGKLILVECKGHPLAWTGKTRSKHQAIKKQFPDMDLRFIFNNKHGKISARSKTTNADWCKRQGFLCETDTIPHSWINE